jgi:hypothetical protein
LEDLLDDDFDRFDDVGIEYLRTRNMRSMVRLARGVKKILRGNLLVKWRMRWPPWRLQW